MISLRNLLIWAVFAAIPCLSEPDSPRYCASPSGYGDGYGGCYGVTDMSSGPQEFVETGEIFDITHKFTTETPVGGSTEGLGKFITLLMSMKNGSDYNFSEMRIPVHSGTHVDAPGHYYDQYYDLGYDVDTLDLRVLNGLNLATIIPCGEESSLLLGYTWLAGPALLVDVPRDKNITAEVMESLKIPPGVRRVIFRTLNTERGLMYQKEFDSSFVGFTEDGAQWLVSNTGIKLVGTDYLSVAAFDHLVSAHLVFLRDMDIILVEGLKLDDVPAGLFTVHCLPLRLVGAEGSPIRCILMQG